MKIDMSLIKELHSAVEFSMGDCLKALQEANGDIEKAKAILKYPRRNIAVFED